MIFVGLSREVGIFVPAVQGVFADCRGKQSAFAVNYMYKHKVGAAVVAVRRAGAIPAFSALNLFLHYNQMVLPGSSYWSIAIGRDIGDVKKDEEGMQTMKVLGQNMAWLMKKVYA